MRRFTFRHAKVCFQTCLRKVMEVESIDKNFLKNYQRRHGTKISQFLVCLVLIEMPKAPVAEEATANHINHSATVETRHLCVAPSYSRETESVPVEITHQFVR